MTIENVALVLFLLVLVILAVWIKVSRPQD